MKITIIGAGVIGMSCAYFLQKAGHDITIIDKGDHTNNCSFGNAGYISPSHFIPLASPGIVAQGLKWMLSDSSPFYIKPRFDTSLFKWGISFYKNANAKTVEKNAPHLNNLLQLSRQLMIDMDNDLGNGFQLEQKGCFMLYKNETTGHHEAELAKEAKQFGIDAPIMSKDEIQQMEPEVELNVLGGVYFPIDCHLHPGHMMATLQDTLIDSGVRFIYNQEVKQFESKEGKIVNTITNDTNIPTDYLIVAAGSWLPKVASLLGISVLLQPGKGYSTTYKGLENNLNYPAILVDDRVAMTPLGRDLRIGGTMELTGINDDINMKRVHPIIAAANSHYNNLDLIQPTKEDVWTGLRPCSPDGLPYLDYSPHHPNVIIAGGHAMLGISMAAGTGYLVNQMVHKKKTTIDISHFRLGR